VADDYASVRAGFPTEFFVRLAGLGIGCPGQRILDLGTGTGTVALGLARRGAEVTALDVSEEMLATTAARAAAQGSVVRCHRAGAEATGLPDATFDVVVAAQCWHWFDRAAAIAEVGRVLRPGGRFVVAYLDWIALPASPAEVTQRVMLDFVSDWRFADNTAFYAEPWRDAAQAGFRHHESFAFDLELAYTREAWVRRMLASGPVMHYLSGDRVIAYGDALSAALSARWPDDQATLAIPHRVVAMIANDPRPREAAVANPPRWRGEVAEINIASEHAAPLRAVELATLVAGVGIAGDRNALPADGDRQQPADALTLIEVEALDQLRAEYGIGLTAAESRRSIATRGVPLNHLIGRRFAVGDAVCRGAELCEPCGHLQRLTRDGVLKGLAHRGGIRAYIEHGGVVRRCDAIVPLE
jgi:SAM-dependent methyltransferase/MOSC domain-containing protein YiiM